MRADRKPLLVACAAMVVLVLAILSLREDAIVPPPPETRSSNARAETAATPIQAGPTERVMQAGPSEQADYFPLSDGFLRNYLVEVSYKSAQPRFGVAKTAVEGREIIRGKEYYKVLLRVTGIREMKEPVLRYCRNSGDAWQELDGARKDDPAFEAVTLPLPPRPGARWDKDTPEERSNWKVEGTETVVLLGKPYPNCLRISYERRLKHEPDYFESGYYFLAPNIGLIKQVALTAGTRITFTLDDRTPGAIAFYTTWAGTYEGITGRAMGGSIHLAADGRYAIKKSKTDPISDTGQYEPHPARDGEMIFRSDAGSSIAYGFRQKMLGPDRTILHLKCLAQDESSNTEYVRDVRNH